MKRNTFFILVGVVIFSVMFSYIYGSITNAQSLQGLEMRKLIATMTYTPEQVAGYRVIMYPDRAEYALSINDLTGKANLIVKGKIIESKVIGKPINDIQFPDVYTIFTLQIEETIKGKVESKTIQIYQPGGNWNGLDFIVYDDPSMKQNDDVILFLIEVEPNLYHIYGGPLGRYIIQENKVYNTAELDSQGKDVPSEFYTHGCSYEQFKKLIP